MRRAKQNEVGYGDRLWLFAKRLVLGKDPFSGHVFAFVGVEATWSNWESQSIRTQCKRQECVGLIAALYSVGARREFSPIIGEGRFAVRIRIHSSSSRIRPNLTSCWLSL